MDVIFKLVSSVCGTASRGAAAVPRFYKFRIFLLKYGTIVEKFIFRRPNADSGPPVRSRTGTAVCGGVFVPKTCFVRRGPGRSMTIAVLFVGYFSYICFEEPTLSPRTGLCPTFAVLLDEYIGLYLFRRTGSAAANRAVSGVRCSFYN